MPQAAPFTWSSRRQPSKTHVPPRVRAWVTTDFEGSDVIGRWMVVPQGGYLRVGIKNERVAKAAKKGREGNAMLDPAKTKVAAS